MARVTVKRIETAINELDGNITKVAEKLGVNRSTIYRRIDKSDRLKKALDNARESMLDHVESALYTKAKQGDTTSMIFFLKTQGKRRGYIERQEHDMNPDGQSIRITIADDD